MEAKLLGSTEYLPLYSDPEEESETHPQEDCCISKELAQWVLENYPEISFC